MAGRTGRVDGAHGRLYALMPALAVSAAAWLTACAAPVGGAMGGSPAPSLAPSRAALTSVAVPPVALRWKAVLVAGDGSLPVFDNATRRLRASLHDGAGVPASDIQRLSSDPATIARESAGASSLDRVLGAIEAMAPAPGQGCLVYVTSHGAPSRGLVLSLNGEALTPGALDRALTAGCGDAPTVAVLSGCYTGIFVRPPVTRPNRVVLSAARADRPSFGCGAGYEYTVFDRCLLDAVGRGGDWGRVYGAVRGCVADAERRGGFPSSEPRAHIGPGMDGVPVPARVGRPAPRA